MGLLVLLSGPAGAAQSQCPSSRGIGTTRVAIVDPQPGDFVAGVVPVRGEARSNAPLTPLDRAELYVNGVLVDAQESPPRTYLPFSLSWDSIGARAGQVTLRVVACGSGPGGMGQSSVPVTVQPRTASTTAPRTTSTVAAALTPTSAPLASVTTTTRPASTTTTSKGARPSPGKKAVAPGTPEEGPRIPDRLALRQGESPAGRRSPLWVGAVVGLTGLAGLAVSTALRVRRPPPTRGRELQRLDGAGPRLDR